MDVEALIESPQLLEEQAGDNVWHVQARSGRRLLHLAFTVVASDEPVKLTGSTVKLRGGTFVAWHVVPSQGDGQFENGPSTATADAPRLSRRVIVHPNRRIEWFLDRSIPGAEALDSNNPYALKVNKKLLRSLKPTRPARRAKAENENPREFRQQRREESKEYGDRLDEYKRTQRSVQALPIRFEESAPLLLWAIFDVSESLRNLTVTGIEPRPWTIRMRQLQSLLGIGDPEKDTQKLLGEIQKTMLRDDHPNTLRVVAYALRRAGVIRQMTEVDALYHLVKALIQADDVVARGIVVDELIEAESTPAAIDLLKLAALDSDLTVKMKALRGVFQAAARDVGTMARTVSEANRFLAGSTDPESILEQLLAVPREAELVRLLVSELRFDALDGNARDRAITYIASRAGTDDLAASWLDQQLLGSPDQGLVDRTLLLLDRAHAGRSFVDPLVRRLFNSWLGPTKAGGSDGALPRPTLTGTVPIGSSSHGLLRALESGDTGTRTLAWHVLRHFVIHDDPQPDPTDSADRTVRRRTDSYTVLVDAALSRSTMPMQAVEAAEFMARQPDIERSTEGLVRLVLSKAPDASLRAAQLLIGSGRPIETALQTIAPDDRELFAAAIYRAIRHPATLATSLMRYRDERNEGVNWFGQQIAEGYVPEPGEWAGSFGGEDTLLDLVTNDDKTLAVGAVGALVLAAGGDEYQARRMGQTMLNQTGQTRADLLENWHEQRRLIYLSRIQKVSGPHLLVLKIYGTARDLGPDAMRAIPFERGRFAHRGGPSQRFEPVGKVQIVQNLGAVDLQVDGEDVSFGTDSVQLSVPDEHLAVRFDNPADLQNLADGAVNKLPLEDLQGWIDLLPEARGIWRGGIQLPDGRQLELIMQPVS